MAVHDDEQDLAAGNVVRHEVIPADESEQKLLLRYLKRKQEDIEKLERALASEDFVLIHRIGHNLAGSGAAYGFIRITELGKHIEAAASRRSLGDLTELITALRGFLATVQIGDLA